jgi:ABC-type protease/lipase transport system fused ATPase/permease subunit
LGLENATLKWKEVVDVEKQKEQGKTKIGVLSPSASSDIPYPTSSNDDVEAVATSYVETAASDSGSLLQTDELCDITVRFPEGQLSVVTGPSASGKTALRVRRRVRPLSPLS